MSTTYLVRVKNKKKVAFTETLLGSFDFLEVKKEKQTATKKSGLSKAREAELVKAFTDVKDALAGKKKLKKADDFLNEL
jgi:hypothetical protein